MSPAIRFKLVLNVRVQWISICWGALSVPEYNMDYLETLWLVIGAGDSLQEEEEQCQGWYQQMRFHRGEVTTWKIEQWVWVYNSDIITGSYFGFFVHYIGIPISILIFKEFFRNYFNLHYTTCQILQIDTAIPILKFVVGLVFIIMVTRVSWLNYTETYFFFLIKVGNFAWWAYRDIILIYLYYTRINGTFSYILIYNYN